MSISVIIPSKTSANLFACVSAVREHEPDARIIVVDDGLDRAPVGVECVQGEKPFCYARNINIGIRAAYRYTTEDISTHSHRLYTGLPEGVVLLNDDAIVMSTGGFSAMAQACRDNPEYGLIGGTSNVVGNPNQFPRNIGLRPESRMVCFLCVYIPRATLDLIGGLDERYSEYGLDDDDYSFAVRAAGLKIGVHDDCYVDHGSLVSSFRGNPKAPADYRQNLRRFIQKWGCDNWNQPREKSQFPELFA
jgi:GT2 family glycosyltransferase